MVNCMDHITICVCTYKRPTLLLKLLNEVAAQETAGRFTFSVSIVDNDAEKSAEAVVSDYLKRAPYPIIYDSEPEQNIALARNRSVQNATGNYIAFIDDDEYPEPTWLLELYRTCRDFSADGVLAPVKPYFEGPAPRWATEGSFYNRPEHGTGYVITLSDARTGNVLLKRSVFGNDPQPFRAKFINGGEDVDFFKRQFEAGKKFVWCNEASVFEIVPPERATRKYLLKRALLRGRNSLKHEGTTSKLILKSIIALPLYMVLIPIVSLGGLDQGFKRVIKLCDHAGRVLALFGLNPVKDR